MTPNRAGTVVVTGQYPVTINRAASLVNPNVTDSRAVRGHRERRRHISAGIEQRGRVG